MYTCIMITQQLLLITEYGTQLHVVISHVCMYGFNIECTCGVWYDPRNGLLIDWLIGEGLGLVVSVTGNCFLIGSGMKKVN